MLKIYKTIKQAIPVKIISFKRYGPLSGEGLQSLRCTCCQHELGSRGWGSAWIDDGTGQRGARLCFDCTEDAEADLAQRKI